MKKAGDLLNSFFDEVQRDEGNEYIKFNDYWHDMVGEKIASRSKIEDIVDGSLIIEIDYPGVKQLILYKEKYIIKTIERKFPQLKVKKIKFNFKNQVSNTVKANDNNLQVTKKTDKKIEMNSDFSELLKKMSKRSEE